MPESSGDKIRQKVLGLVSKLPPPDVRKILEEIDGGKHGSPDSIKAAKASLVDYLNKKRPYRVRRLYTDLFDPFLTSDDVLLRSPAPLYGLVSRVDIGGLWVGVSRVAFPELVRKVQSQLDEQARSTLLEHVLVSPEALDYQEQMRVATVGFLGVLGNDRAAAGRFLKMVNVQRQRDIGSRSLYLEKIYDIDEAYLKMISDILVHRKEFSRQIRDFLALVPEFEFDGVSASGNCEKLAERVIHTTDDLLQQFQDRKIKSNYWRFISLSVVHIKRRYDVAGLCIRYDRSERAGDGPLAEALRGHFEACCRTIREVLSGALRLDERVALSSLKMTAAERAKLDQEMTRLNVILESLVVSGLLGTQSTAFGFRRWLIDLDAYFTGRIAWAMIERVQAALAARDQPSPDFEDVIWLCRYLSLWQEVAHKHRLDETEIKRWRAVLGDEGKAALKKSLEIEEGEHLSERMAHLVRLQRILGLLGVRVMKAVPISSQNAARIILDRIKTSQRLPAEEAEMISDFVALARVEKQKLRHWSDMELSEMLRIADISGY
ncbi:putative DUF2336 domain-containing protein [uncultured Gammaproteobacteria bacterium]